MVRIVEATIKNLASFLVDLSLHIGIALKRLYYQNIIKMFTINTMFKSVECYVFERKKKNGGKVGV